MKLQWTMGSVGIGLLIAVAWAPDRAWAEAFPGLAGSVYSDAALMSCAMPTQMASMAFTMDVTAFRENHPTNQGWSLALFGQLRIDKPGAYSFKTDGGSPTEFWLGDRRVDLVSGAPLKVAEGWVPLRLYARSPENNPLAHPSVKVGWREPGSSAFQPIPEERIRHERNDKTRQAVYEAWIPLVGSKRPLHNRRVFTVNVPKAGFYEYVSGMIGGRGYQVWLDGLQVYYRPGRILQDPADQRRGAFGEYRFVRYLTRGTHEFIVYAHADPWPWNDETGAVLARHVPRLALLGPDSPADRLTITPKDREDLVFRKGEPLVLRFERAAEDVAHYWVHVRRQRGDGAVVWRHEVAMRAMDERAVADVAYSCDQEGAFEYTVTDDGGNRVDGPWEFVVVDPTPLPLPRERGQAQAQPVLVDTVDCTNTNDPLHEFRDNGTSAVMEGPGGKYRVTGTNALKWVSYLQTNGVWRVAREGEKGTKTFTTLNWFAFTLRVKHPGRQHLVVAWIPNDVPRSVPVQVYDQVSGQYNANSLWAGLAPEAGAFSPLFIPVWPNGDLDAMMLTDGKQRGARYPYMDMAITEGAVARLELYEYPDGLPPLPEPAEGWGKNKDFTWIGEQWNLSMEQRMMPKLWEGNRMRPAIFPTSHHFNDGFYDWRYYAGA
ncbi:MAG: hypothetical protein PHR35_17830 [Kiritimatiellae bacterium]|nr:hypothetical protein [Kiritimatiellia bacterium]